MSLQSKLNNGFLWTFIDSIALRGLYFIAQLFLANLLGPKVFGLMLPLSFIYAIGNVLLDSGLSSSLIRKDNVDDDDYNTIFIVNLFFAIFLYLIFFISAPFIAEYYKQPILSSLIRVYCLGFVFSGIGMVQNAILTKKLEFKKLTQINIVGTLAGVISGLLLGYYGFGIWSLVSMYLVSQLCNTLLIWSKTQWLPKYTFSVPIVKEHFNFGYKLTISALINVSLGNIYALIIPKFYPMVVSGYYERAYNLNQYPVSVLSSVISRVTFPLMSKIQRRENVLREFYRSVIKTSFFIIAPLMLFAAVLAEPLFNIIFKEDWFKAIPYFQLLCISSILFPLQLFNVNILKVKGKSDVFLRIEIFKKAIQLLFLFFTYDKGIENIIIGLIGASFIGFLINSYFCGREINYTTLSQIKDLIPITIITLISVILLYFSYYFLKTRINSYFLFIFGFSFGFFVYITLSYFFLRKQLQIVLKIIQDLNIVKFSI